MARFETAIPVVLRHEGGYVNHPSDPGGETNFGISKRSYPNVDIKNLTRRQAKEIYRRDFWRPGKYERLDSQPVATKAFDLAVNMGPSRAHKLLQRAVNAKLPRGRKRLLVDGKIGRRTLDAANEVGGKGLLSELRAEAAQFYVGIVLRKPDKKVFLRGWLRRAVS